MHAIDPIVRTALDAIAESRATGGAVVTIPDVPGVIDALQDRADDWAGLSYGIEIGGRAIVDNGDDGIEIEYWRVFVMFAN